MRWEGNGEKRCSWEKEGDNMREPCSGRIHHLKCYGLLFVGVGVMALQASRRRCDSFSCVWQPGVEQLGTTGCAPERNLGTVSRVSILDVVSVTIASFPCGDLNAPQT